MNVLALRVSTGPAGVVVDVPYFGAPGAGVVVTGPVTTGVAGLIVAEVAALGFGFGIVTVPEHAPDVGDPKFAQAVKVLAAAVTVVALVVVGDPGPGAVVVVAELNGAGVPATVFTVGTPLIVVVVTV